MIKKKQLSPPDKKLGKAPFFSRSFDYILKDSMRKEERRLISVQIVTSPYTPTEAYRKGYDEINWKS